MCLITGYGRISNRQGLLYHYFRSLEINTFIFIVLIYKFNYTRHDIHFYHNYICWFLNTFIKYVCTYL